MLDGSSAMTFFTFAVPYKIFKEMENNVEGSFLEVGAWLKLLKYIG